MKFNVSRRNSAFTLIETTVAAAIAALFLASLFALNSQVLSMLRGSKETSFATQLLIERIEALRAAGWSNIAFKDGLKNGIYAAPATTVSNFPIISETVVATPYYPPPNTAPTTLPTAFELTRNLDGTFPALPSGSSNTGTDLRAAPAIKVRLIVQWRGAGGRFRQREMTSVFSKKGL